MATRAPFAWEAVEYKATSLASREDILTHRTLTYLLSLTEQLRIENDADLGERTSRSPKVDNSFDRKVKSVLDHFVNLMVQRSEVVAIVPTGKTPFRDIDGNELIIATETYNTTDVSDQGNPKPVIDELASSKGVDELIICKNPREDTFPAVEGLNPRIPIPPPKVTLSTRIPQNYEIPTEFGIFLRALVTLVRASPTANVPTEQHLSISQAFLTKFTDYNSLSASDHHKLWKDWRCYIVFACAGKIRTRVQRGMVDDNLRSGLIRNIWDHLTMPASTFKHAAKTIELGLEKFPEPSSAVLNAKQQQFLENEGRRHILTTGPFYADERRFEFQDLMSNVFQHCDNTLEKFEAEKKKIEKMPQMPNNQELDILLELLTQAMDGFYDLYQFQKLFQDFIDRHLRNIERAFQLTNTTHEARQKLMSPKGTILKPTADEKNPSKLPHAPAKPGRMPSFALSDDAGQSLMNSDLSQEQSEAIVLEDEWEARGWAKAASRYVVASTHHFHSASVVAKTAATRRDLSHIFQRPLKLLHIDYTSKDQQMARIEDVIDTFLSASGRDQALLDYLRTNFPFAVDQKKTPAFNGVIHCEAMIMQTYLLAHDADAQSLLQDGHFVFDPPAIETFGVKRRGLSSGDKEILNESEKASKARMAFDITPDAHKVCRDMAPIVAVSKYCCPVCNKIMKYVERKLSTEDNRRRMIRPSFHTTYTATTLAPWATQAVAEYAIDEAVMALKFRMDYLEHTIAHKGVDTRRHTSSSQTPAPSNAPSSVMSSPSKNTEEHLVLPSRPT